MKNKFRLLFRTFYCTVSVCFIKINSNDTAMIYHSVFFAYFSRVSYFYRFPSSNDEHTVNQNHRRQRKFSRRNYSAPKAPEVEAACLKTRIDASLQWRTPLVIAYVVIFSCTRCHRLWYPPHYPQEVRLSRQWLLSVSYSKEFHQKFPHLRLAKYQISHCNILLRCSAIISNLLFVAFVRQAAKK